MKPSSIKELKVELQNLPQHKTVEFCLRLAKFKKENKELLTFLLFEANDRVTYILNIKIEIENEFEAINFSSVYFIKKSLRKILRLINKYIRYAADNLVEVELILFFCEKINQFKTAIKNNNVIANIYQNQFKKMNKTIFEMHQDLQYDYLKKIEAIK